MKKERKVLFFILALLFFIAVLRYADYQAERTGQRLDQIYESRR